MGVPPVPRRAELARTLTALEDALVVAREEIDALVADEDWFLLLRTGRVNSMRSHVQGMLRKVRQMRELAGVSAQPAAPATEPGE